MPNAEATSPPSSKLTERVPPQPAQGSPVSPFHVQTDNPKPE